MADDTEEDENTESAWVTQCFSQPSVFQGVWVHELDENHTNLTKLVCSPSCHSLLFVRLVYN